MTNTPAKNGRGLGKLTKFNTLFLMFAKIVGNDYLKQILRRMIRVDRIPAAVIFAGNEGVGKRLFAFELAKSRVCQNPQQGEACELCAACLRADVLELPRTNDKDDNEKVFFTAHPDIGLIRPAGKFITVDTVRLLQAETVVRPFEAAARFFIIDEADKMNAAAANALLKTLEEPPATSHLILLTARPNALLQTIRSRCQILRFAPVAANEIENFLRRSDKVSPNDAKLLARVSAGSIGRAVSINPDYYKQQREMMLGILDAISRQDRARLLKIAEELNDAKLKDEYETRLEILEMLVHDIWQINLGAGETANADLQTKLTKIAEKIDSRRLVAWLAEIENLRENLTVNLNRKIATDALFLRMADD
jgi:DNA polymerase-3 subunit delta'